jgi:two-component system KDP operon response regulator KdpE
MQTLYRQPGSKVLTHSQPLHEAWGPSHAEHSHYLRAYMGHMRRKIEADPARPAHIITNTGLGHRLVGD